MSDIKLKPCPFCGGKAEFIECTIALKNAIAVRCTKCNVKTESRPESVTYCARDYVISDWNKRSGSEDSGNE